MTGIDFLDDIHHAHDFGLFGREFKRTNIIYDNEYYGRLHSCFMFPDHDEKFTTWIFESVEKIGLMFEIIYTIKLHVSDKIKSRKGIEITGQFHKGKMNVDISHDLMECRGLYGSHEVVDAVIKEIRHSLIHEASISLYDADTENVSNHIIGEMAKDEFKRSKLEQFAYEYMYKQNFKR